MLTLQIDIHHIRPDQIIRSQHIKRRRHAGTFEIAPHIHFFFDLLNLFLIHKHFEVTGIFKINLRRQ